MKFVKLVIDELKSGPVSVTVQRETAAHFGWDTAFPEWNQRFRDGYPGGRRRGLTRMSRSENDPGGDRLRICRDKRKTGYPAGKTHCFRLKGCWSKRHLVQLAQVAGEKFEWMESKYGERVDRDVWLSSVARVKPPAE